MARVNVETRALAESRFSNLAEELGLSRSQTIGVLVIFWHDSQERGVWKASREVVAKLIPVPKGERDRYFEALLEAEYLSPAEDGSDDFVIRGNRKHIDALGKQKEGASEGGKQSGKARRKKSKDNNAGEPEGSQVEGEPSSSELNAVQCNAVQGSSKQSSSKQEQENLFASGSPSPNAGSKEPSPVALVWRAYAAAFESRHGSGPLWNAKIAGQLKQFVRRVPAEEAPKIAAFFVRHNAYRYVSAMHPVGMLLQDAEKLRTEWITGTQVTSTQARALDQKQSTASAFGSLIAEAEARENGGHHG